MSVKIQEMSKTYQYRKVMKPLLERKRRARINKCLDELKNLMSECLVQQGENIVRLEKADILELTVDHLKRLRTKINNTITNNNTTSLNDQSFRSGYVYAVNEISKALASYPGVNISLGTKVMAHLGHRLIQIENQKQEIMMTSSLTSPLNVYCGNNITSINCKSNNNKNNNISNINREVNYNNINCNYNSAQQLSPVSSGYGSDNETISPSINHEYHNHHYHQGLLKIAAISKAESSKQNIWRPW